MRPSTWISKKTMSEIRSVLRLCPDKDVREEGLACLRNAKPEYLVNLIPSNHPDRSAALRWVIQNAV